MNDMYIPRSRYLACMNFGSLQVTPTYAGGRGGGPGGVGAGGGAVSRHLPLAAAGPTATSFALLPVPSCHQLTSML